MNTHPTLGLAAVLAALLCLQAAPAAAQSEAEAAGIVADQVRDQGHKCADPVTATRDAAESAPELPVWILECADARYKVRIVPDQGAEIESID